MTGPSENALAPSTRIVQRRNGRLYQVNATAFNLKVAPRLQPVVCRCDDTALGSSFVRHCRSAYGQVDFTQSRREGCSIDSVV